MANRSVCVLASLVLAVSVALAQKTTNITLTLKTPIGRTTATGHVTGIGSASLPSLGAVMMNVDLTQPEDPNNNNPLGDYKGTISFAFNRLDSFDVSVDIPNGNGNPAPITGKITGGKGAYQGATGSVTVDITVAPDGNSVVVTGSGTITTAATGVPVITDVSTAFGNSEIAPNTWMVIKGTNLVPSNTHA